MKRINNLYCKICDIDNIIKYTNIVYKNATNKLKIEKYDEDYMENIYNIHEDLITKTYKTDKYNIFIIRKPKYRIVMSQNIKDKIVNRLVAKFLLSDILDKTFIEGTVATRKGKGLNYGIRLTKKYINELKKDNKEIYYLKFDVKKYFYSINHSIAMKILEHKIKDGNALNIIREIISATDEDYVNKEIINLKSKEIEKVKRLNINNKEKNKRIEEIENIPLYEKGKALPIGSMTSQVIAIMYLDKLNHFIKEKLHISKYVIYMDDGLLLYNDKEYLEKSLKAIDKFLRDNLDLELNYKKTKIGNVSDGFDFIGYKFLLHNDKLIMRVRKSTKNKIRRKLRKSKKKLNEKIININKYKAKIKFYNKFLITGKCSKLVRKYRI